MKKALLTLLICLIASFTFADNIFFEGFEYANHDMTTPIGWTCPDESWLCGYMDKDHNRAAHSGNWYAFTNADESWMFMPLFFSSQLKYRFSYWAISDGTYDVEFWAGDEGDAAHMTQLLFSTTISGDEYEKISTYIESIPSNFQYFGIHAVAAEGAYHLTIDDIEVDMVNKFEFAPTPYSADTVLYPNTQAIYNFDVQNLGYEPIDVIFSPSHEYFTDIHFYVNGSQCTTFHLEPDETKSVITEATLLPTIQAGTTCWLDILMVLDCDCATAMTTLWVTVLDPTETDEHIEDIELFPNPANEHLNIRGKDLKLVEITDLHGKKINSTTTKQDEICLDLTNLKSGIYVITTVSDQNISVRKFIKK